MLTAPECRAKADHLAVMADTASSYAIVLEWERMAMEWRKLGEIAEWQDAFERQLRDGA